MNHGEGKRTAPSANELGTFGGVFTPSILTILGVIMFMRAGFVVGQAGVLQALLILVLAKSISLTTSLSIAAVSTNTPVAGGGAYFLISRSLGPEFGGAIGLALFLAQAVSVPFYILGFTESLVRSFPEMTAHFRSIGLVTAAVLFVIAYVGARWAVKAQYLIMAILGLSIFAFLGGAVHHFETGTFLDNWKSAYSGPNMSFWVVFAIYFPAVTGIMAGVNMSGDLKDPGRSIPRGTLAASCAAVLVVLFYIYLRRRMLRVSFGDARWGFAFVRLRNSLLRLARMPVHPKNWRPILLVLTGNPLERPTLSTYALWMGSERGLVTLSRVLVGDPVEISHLQRPAAEQLRRFLDEGGFQALTSVVVSEDLDEGMAVLLEGHPLSPLRPNTVVMGWSSDPERASFFVQHLRTARRLGMSLILVHDKGLPQGSFNRRIDVWWRGQENGSLMILVAHLLTLNWEWLRAKVRVLRLIRDEAGRQPSREALEKLVSHARMDAEVEVIVSDDEFPKVLERHSSDASVVILGFKIPEEREEEAFRFQMYFERMISPLPTTLLVSSSGEADVFV